LIFNVKLFLNRMHNGLVNLEKVEKSAKSAAIRLNLMSNEWEVQTDGHWIRICVKRIKWKPFVWMPKRMSRAKNRCCKWIGVKFYKVIRLTLIRFTEISKNSRIELLPKLLRFAIVINCLITNVQLPSDWNLVHNSLFKLLINCSNETELRT